MTRQKIHRKQEYTFKIIRQFGQFVKFHRCEETALCPLFSPIIRYLGKNSDFSLILAASLPVYQP